MKKFKLILISAMNENGGNVIHRFLDGHPQLLVYPFESQLGTQFVNDNLTSLYPVKYRWPVFPGSLTINEIYDMIIDEECKVRAKTPYVSKFRQFPFDFSDLERLYYFKQYLQKKPLNRLNIIRAYFESTFKAWKNCKRTNKELFYVGYSPIIGIDGETIIKEMGKSVFIIHVIRNPFSAYSDSKKRPLPQSLPQYITGWFICHYFAKINASKFPKNFFILRYEDIVENPAKVLGEFLAKLGIKESDTLAYPSWNGRKLTQVHPWGTIKIPSSKENLKTAKHLNQKEIEEIYLRVKDEIAFFGYDHLFHQLSS